jgi:hypothetical protein
LAGEEKEEEEEEEEEEEDKCQVGQAFSHKKLVWS